MLNPARFFCYTWGIFVPGNIFKIEPHSGKNMCSFQPLRAEPLLNEPCLTKPWFFQRDIKCYPPHTLLRHHKNSLVGDFRCVLVTFSGLPWIIMQNHCLWNESPLLWLCPRDTYGWEQPKTVIHPRWAELATTNAWTARFGKQVQVVDQSFPYCGILVASLTYRYPH